MAIWNLRRLVRVNTYIIFPASKKVNSDVTMDQQFLKILCSDSSKNSSESCFGLYDEYEDASDNWELSSSKIFTWDVIKYQNAFEVSLPSTLQMMPLSWDRTNHFGTVATVVEILISEITFQFLLVGVSRVNESGN